MRLRPDLDRLRDKKYDQGFFHDCHVECRQSRYVQSFLPLHHWRSKFCRGKWCKDPESPCAAACARRGVLRGVLVKHGERGSQGGILHSREAEGMCHTQRRRSVPVTSSVFNQCAVRRDRASFHRSSSQVRWARFRLHCPRLRYLIDGGRWRELFVVPWCFR